MIRYMIEKIHMSVKGNYAKGIIPHIVVFRVILGKTLATVDKCFWLNQQAVGT